MRCKAAFIALLCVTAFVAMLTARAQATPEFARETMLSCNACHAVGTQLTTFGASYKASGFRVPVLNPPGDLPVAVRGQMVYSSDPDPTGLPKAIVDEVDILSAGPLGKNISYNSEVYVLDGGRIGSGREAWLEYRSDRKAYLPLRLRAGLQVLPIPVDPERFRETNAHYAVYDQAIGDNPFTFFDPHNAARLDIGHDAHGLDLSLLAVDPHDPQSALPRGAMDHMLALNDYAGSNVFGFYRYDGTRNLAAGMDRFWRQGFSYSAYRGRFALNAVLQQGFDSNAFGTSGETVSSGGFVQGRYQLGAYGFTIVRYDGTSDSTGSFSRALSIGAGTLFARAFRIELEDTMTRIPQTHHAFSVVLGFGVSTVHEGSFAY